MTDGSKIEPGMSRQAARDVGYLVSRGYEPCPGCGNLLEPLRDGTGGFYECQYCAVRGTTPPRVKPEDLDFCPVCHRPQGACDHVRCAGCDNYVLSSETDDIEDGEGYPLPYCSRCWGGSHTP